MSFALKKQIAGSLRGIGITTLDANAVTMLADFVQGDADTLNEFMKQWQSDGLHGDRLSVSAVESVIAQMSGAGAGGGARQGLELCSVINAFTVPKISYDPVGRKLYADTEPRSIFAPANAKAKLYLDRLHLIAQRIRRSTLFQPQTFNGSSHSPQLTDIQSLKGAALGSKRFVLGCISRSEDGRYVLEDSSGSVPLDLSKAMTASGFYTENCIVLAEGEMNVDGAFHAQAMGLPPAEPRENLPMAAQRLNFFGGPEINGEDRGSLVLQEMDRDLDRIVVLSDVFLDQKEVLDSLHTLFSGYNEMDPSPPLFLLLGNFHSKAASLANAPGGGGVDLPAMRDNFNSLAAVIEQYPKLRQESRFVLVPGPQDPGSSNSLPQPPLAAFFTHELTRVLGPNITFTSNPCRIRYLSQEIVVFRYDILKRMRRRCLVPPANVTDWLSTGSLLPGIIPPLGHLPPSRIIPGEVTQQGQAAATHEVMWEHLALTLLQQSHLCPLPLLLQPIYWQYDHAMGLYPLPHAVVVADSSPQAQMMHQGCVVFNPGSFAEGGLFAAYKPCGGQQVELNEVPRDGILPTHDEEEEEEEEDGGMVEEERVEGEDGGLIDQENLQVDHEALGHEEEEEEDAERVGMQRDEEGVELGGDSGGGMDEDDVEAVQDQEEEGGGGQLQGDAKRMRVTTDEGRDAMDQGSDGGDIKF